MEIPLQDLKSRLNLTYNGNFNSNGIITQAQTYNNKKYPLNFFPVEKNRGCSCHATINRLQIWEKRKNSAQYSAVSVVLVEQ